MELVLVIAAALGGAAVLLAPALRRLADRCAGPAADVLETPPPPAFDPVAAAQELLAAEGEVRGLYERIGFSLDLERRAQALMEDVKALVVVEIPDFAAFCRAVAEIEDAVRGGKGDDALAAARRARAGDPLLRAVAEAADEAEVLVALGRAPVDEVLPFLEQLPLLRGGSVVWRTPVALEVLHKRAGEPELMLRRLDELIRLVKTAPLRREARSKAELLAAAAALRQAVEQGHSYLVTPIRTLEEKLAAWYLAPEETAGRDRRRQTDELLLELVGLRQQVLSPMPEERSAGELRERAVALAQAYVSRPFLHAPRLGQLVLEPLLAAEAASLPPRQHRKPDSAGRILEVVAAEICSGRFDSEESVRRLRSLEACGVFVHSLVYRLLAMSQP